MCDETLLSTPRTSDHSPGTSNTAHSHRALRGSAPQCTEHSALLSVRYISTPTTNTHVRPHAPGTQLSESCRHYSTVDCDQVHTHTDYSTLLKLYSAYDDEAEMTFVFSIGAALQHVTQ